MNNADYYQYQRPEVLALIPECAKRILDVGCGAGVLGASLKHRQPCEVTGIEFVIEAAALARDKLDRVIQGDFSANAHQLMDSYYDAIVLADVLEHLQQLASGPEIYRMNQATINICWYAKNPAPRRSPLIFPSIHCKHDQFFTWPSTS